MFNRFISNKKIILGASILLIGFTSCDKEDNDDLKQPFSIPSSYDGSSFVVNTVEQNNLLNQLSALTSEAKNGRTSGVVVSRQTLENLFVNGNPSLSAEITDYYKNKLEGDNGWFDELAKSSGTTWTPQSPDGSSEGGVFGSYLFDENGVEIEQLVEKGQFGATFYNHATKIMSSTMTLQKVDQLVAIYGAKPSFSNSGSNNVAAENRDVALANYAARRDKNDGNGMYTQIKEAFIVLQAAVKLGDEYKQEQEIALNKIKELWEKINAATVINYCHSPISALSNTNPTDAQKSGALHAIGEAIGFLQGLKTVNPQFRKITDSQIDEILVLFNAPANGTATVYAFATNPSTELAKLQQAITRLQNIYGFSNQEIEDFKSNWVNVQGR